MALYQLTVGGLTVIRESDGAFIPVAPGNIDYAAYLAWVAAGNTPDAAPVVGNPVTISANAFLARFTASEELAVQAAANSNAAIALGLTMGLAKGSITLQGDPVVANWMAALVTVGAITSARSTAILTP